MAADWIRVARRVAASIAEFTEVAPRERWLTDELLEFVFEPKDPASATMELIASSDQLAFFAGRGARLELDAPERASEEAVDLARAVASGRLTEIVRRHRVRFVIGLRDGKEVSGSSTLRKDRRKREQGTYHYAPYPAVKSENS